MRTLALEIKARKGRLVSHSWRFNGWRRLAARDYLLMWLAGGSSCHPLAGGGGFEVVTRLGLGVSTSTATVVEVAGLHDQVDLPFLREGRWIARC